MTYRNMPQVAGWVTIINPETKVEEPGAAWVAQQIGGGDLYKLVKDGRDIVLHHTWLHPVDVASLVYQKQQLAKLDTIKAKEVEEDDDINHPKHYTSYKGIEVIQLTEQMMFNRGNAVKYIARAGLKSKETEIQDLEKAAWYVNREIARIKEGQK